MGSRRRLNNQARKPNKFMHETEQCRKAILGPDGGPAEVKFQPLSSPGPMQHPVVFAQVPMGNKMVLPVVGGATRLETCASRIAAGMARYFTPDIDDDEELRRKLAKTSVALAFDIISESLSFQAPEPPPCSPATEPTAP